MRGGCAMSRRAMAAVIGMAARLLIWCGELCAKASRTIGGIQGEEDIDRKYDLSTREGRAAAAAELNAKRYR